MTRYAAVAGMFYPKKKEELNQMLDRFLKTETPKISGTLRAIVVPHAGYIYSGEVAAKAFSLLKKIDQEREWRVIILGPSHTTMFSGASLSIDGEWATPLGNVNVCKKAHELISDNIIDYKAAHFQEHCLEVEVPFIQKTLKRFCIVPILTGEISPVILADEIEKMLGENTIIVISSDLSHYLSDEDARKIDEVSNKSVPKLDFDRFNEKGDACGKTAILALIYMAKKLGWKGHFIDYKTSGDTAGDKYRVVGYGAYAFTGD